MGQGIRDFIDAVAKGLRWFGDFVLLVWKWLQGPLGEVERALRLLPDFYSLPLQKQITLMLVCIGTLFIIGVIAFGIWKGIKGFLDVIIMMTRTTKAVLFSLFMGALLAYLGALATNRAPIVFTW